MKSNTPDENTPDENNFIDEQASKLERISKRLSGQIRPTNKSQQERLDHVRDSLDAVRRNTRRSNSSLRKSRKQSVSSVENKDDDTDLFGEKRVSTRQSPMNRRSKTPSKKSNTDETYPTDSSISKLYEETSDVPEAPVSRVSSKPRVKSNKGIRDEPIETRALNRNQDTTVVTHPFGESLANMSNASASMLKNAGQSIQDTFKIQSVSDLLNKTSAHVQKAMEQSNDVDVNTLDTVEQTAKDVFSVGSGIAMYVIKLFVLICILAYTFTIDTVRCKCADTPRKLLVQCTASMVLLFVVVVLVYPQLYEKVPVLKILLMITTLLLAYGVVTYFPIMNNANCNCAQQSWLKYVGEYYVYIALVLFVLALCGIRIL